MNFEELSMMNRKKILFAICFISILCFSQPKYASANNSTVDMANMHEKESQYCETISDNIVDSYYGETHGSNIYKMDASNWAYVVYDLNGQYSSFSGTLVASTDTGRGALMNIAIFVDGILKWDFSEFSKQNKPEDIMIDLSGASTFSVKTSNSGEYSYGWIFFIDSKFTKSGQPVVCNEYASLSIPHVIDANKYNYSKNLMQDSYGLFHDGSHYLDASQNALVLYNLNREYSTLSYSIVTSPETGSGASMSIKVFFDGVEQPSLFCSGITKQTKKVSFSSIDVSNVETLKIETSNEGEYSCGWLYIVDDILSIHSHTNGDWTIKTEATCNKTGQKVQYCTECGEICTSESIPASGHKASNEWIETVPSTCAMPGEKVQYCSVCGDIIKTQSIDCIPHTEGAEWEVLTEASCIKTGERAKRCVECNAIIETEDIEMVPHYFSEWTVSSKFWELTPSEESRSCIQCGFLETRKLKSMPVCWLIYLAIGMSIVTVIVVFRLYPSKFRRFLTLDIILHHIILAMLMFYYKINLRLLLFVVVASILIYLLPSNFLTLLSTIASVLGIGAANLWGLQNTPLFVVGNFIYIVVATYLKTHHQNVSRTQKSL